MAGQVVAKDAFVALGGRDLSGDLNTCTITRNAETPDVTTFGENTRQRVTGGIVDWSMSLAGGSTSRLGTGSSDVIRPSNPEATQSPAGIVILMYRILPRSPVALSLSISAFAYIVAGSLRLW